MRGCSEGSGSSEESDVGLESARGGRWKKFEDSLNGGIEDTSRFSSNRECRDRFELVNIDL